MNSLLRISIDPGITKATSINEYIHVVGPAEINLNLVADTEKTQRE